MRVKVVPSINETESLFSFPRSNQFISNDANRKQSCTECVLALSLKQKVGWEEMDSTIVRVR